MLFIPRGLPTSDMLAPKSREGGRVISILRRLPEPVPSREQDAVLLCAESVTSIQRVLVHGNILVLQDVQRSLGGPKAMTTDLRRVYTMIR
jgi:hypothetical protein